MLRMVRITAANTSTYYCCIPSRTQTAYRLIKVSVFRYTSWARKMQFLLFGSAVLPMIKGDFAFAMMSNQFVLLFQCFKSSL